MGTPPLSMTMGTAAASWNEGLGMRASLTSVSMVLVVGCGLSSAPPVEPPESGCYRLDTNLPASYTDSLGYVLPDRVRFGTRFDHRAILPTGFEWKPYLRTYDGLPSTYPSGPISGDSIDVVFPGPIGDLVLRVGGPPVRLSGRAEWVYGGVMSYLNEGRWVELTRADCQGVPIELERR